MSICPGCWQQAAPAFCLLPMKAKDHAARSESKTLGDRYDTETTSCFILLRCTTQKQLEMGFSHKQKVQLVRMILGQPEVNIQHSSAHKGLQKVTLIMWLSATLK